MTSDAEKSFKAKLRAIAKEKNRDPADLWQSLTLERFLVSMLLEHVEKIARILHCYLAHLDTFDFQAKDFYLKHGYSIFGVLENAPKGHNRY